MTLVLGIDPSAKKIAVVARETILNVQRADAFILYKGSETQNPITIHRAMEAMNGFLGDIDTLAGSGPRYAYVEKPLVGRGGVMTTIKQAYVGGVIRACLVAAGFTVYDVNQSTWKSFHGVKGKGTAAQKVATAQVVKTQWPKIEAMISGDGDLADAAAICLYGCEQVRKAGALVSDAGLAGSTVQRARRPAVVRPPRLRT